MADIIFTCIIVGVPFFVLGFASGIILMCEDDYFSGRGVPEAPPTWNSGKEDNR